MSFEKASKHLINVGYGNRIITFKELSSTVEQASLVLKCSQGEIAKTLSFLVGDKVIVVVVAGDVKISNSKYKQEFGTKAKMISFDDVERLTGHAVGGVCPFGLNNGVTVYLDETLKKYEYVYPACGDCHSAVKLKPEEFVNIVKIEKWVDVCLVN